MKRNKYIGVFDSGFGGISTLRGLVKKLPRYNYIYLGDSARTPYGTRSQKVIYDFCHQAVDFLFQKKCNLIIFACNTASSRALRKIQKNYIKDRRGGKKVLGVLIPLAEEAVEKTKNKRVGVIGTESTIESKAYVREIQIMNKSIKIYQKATPLLVPFVESGEYNSLVIETILKKYLKNLLRKNIDTLILGCTHYGILERKIRKITGPKINIISDKYIVPKKLKEYLERHQEIESEIKKEGKIIFYTTDLTKKFINLGSKFFGKRIKVKKTIL